MEFDLEKLLLKLESEDTIYHYTTYNNALQYILPKQSLKFSSLSKTNDPYEYKFALLGGVGSGGIDDETIRKSDEAHPIIDRYRRNLSRIGCFSMNDMQIIENHGELEKVNGYGCCKSRMWAQYGQNHYGVCLAINKNLLVDEIKSKYELFNSGEVQYTNKYYKEEFTLDFNELRKKSLDVFCKEHILKHMNSFFFRKHEDFRDEKEYRIVFIEDEEKDSYVDIKQSIIAIFVGDRFPDGHLPSISFHSEYYHIPCARVYYDQGNPHILYCKNLERNMDDYYSSLKIMPEKIKKRFAT